MQDRPKSGILNIISFEKFIRYISNSWKRLLEIFELDGYWSEVWEVELKLKIYETIVRLMDPER